MASKKQTIYTIVSLGIGDRWREDIDGAFEDALVSTCTNKMVLSEMTGIDRDRLAYVFIRKKKNIYIGKDFIIFKADVLYKGRQEGGLRNPSMTNYNRN